MPTEEDLLAAAQQPAEDALRLHPFYKGKIQTALKCPIRDSGDFAIWYTPGVAAPCRQIQHDPDLVYEHTNKANTVAIVTDGTRVLGLGDIGPEASLPVMEGKALLFKYLGGVDAVPICLRTRDPDELIAAVRMLEPAFGGINLEDIAQPKCFRILDQLRTELDIPVWHDDQQGTATVLLAGLMNALELVGKDMRNARIAMIGMGAANVAAYRLLVAYGVDPAAIVACDSKGVLHRGRNDIEAQMTRFSDKWRVCMETNVDGITGGISDALRGADVAVAFSAPKAGLIQTEWVRNMAPDAIVFACANPTPEIWPWEATEAGVRIIATGRSDFSNQVNNSLAFPGIFRGALDVRARTITDEMAIEAAKELAQYARERGLSDEYILPGMDEWQVVPRVAVATATKAQQQNVARLTISAEEIQQQASAKIENARKTTQALMRENLIPAAE